MKLLFIEAKSDLSVVLPRNVEILPEKIGLVSTVQYVDQMIEFKKLLESAGKKVFIGKSGKTKHDGQVLGCDAAAALSIRKEVDAVVFIGEGMFHPQLLLMKIDKPVFAFNPAGSKLVKLNDRDVRKWKTQQKVALMRYYSAEDIGILVSTKSGQMKLDAALNLKQKLQKEGKRAYLLAFDTLNIQDLENFPFIKAFVNTACPRISIDEYKKFRKPVVNIEDLSLA